MTLLSQVSNTVGTCQGLWHYLTYNILGSIVVLSWIPGSSGIFLWEGLILNVLTSAIKPFEAEFADKVKNDFSMFVGFVVARKNLGDQGEMVLG